MASKIEWCDETVNPVIGCSKISPGCDNCYAEKMACRLAHMGNRDYQDITASPIRVGVHPRNDNWFQHWSGKTTFRPSELEKPIKWKKPRRVFVCSMGDLFHDHVRYNFQWAVFEMMRKAYWHTFYILTKRPENMREFIARLQADKSPDFIRWPLPNVFLGVTAENQEQADKRIPELMKMDGCTKFVSVEPMLGPVDLSPWLPHFLDFSYTTNPGRLDWVICGGESGPCARPMHPDWARGLRDQCSGANVPFFFKQWGEFVPALQTNTLFNLSKTRSVWMNSAGEINGKIDQVSNLVTTVFRIGKKKAGRLLDGVTHNEIPSL